MDIKFYYTEDKPEAGFSISVASPDEVSINMAKIVYGMVKAMIRREENAIRIIDLANTLQDMQDWIRQMEMKGPVQE